MSAFSATDFSYLDPNAIAGLTAEQVSNIEPDAMAAFTMCIFKILILLHTMAYQPLICSNFHRGFSRSAIKYASENFSSFAANEVSEIPEFAFQALQNKFHLSPDAISEFQQQIFLIYQLRLLKA